MSKIIKIAIGIIVLIVIILLIASTNKKNIEPIKIGFIGPLSGDATSYGEPIKKGTEIAVSEINKNGGINGRKLEVIYEDGRCSGKDVTSASQKLISIDKVKVIIGMICSSEVLSAAPIAEAAKVVLIGLGTSPDITNAGDYVFRISPSDNIVGSSLVESMIKNSYKTVAVISGTTPYTSALQKDFESKINKSNIKLVSSENYTENTKDFRSILQKIKVTNPETIYINAQTPIEGGLIAQQARDLGIKSQFYTVYFSGPDFVGLGKAVEGTYVADSPSLDQGNSRVVAFINEIKTRYGSEPTYPFFSAAAYDQVYLVADILNKVGTSDSDKIKNALYSTSKFDGLTGTFGFDKNGDVYGISLRMTQIKDGKLVKVN